MGKQASCLVANQAVEFPQVLANTVCVEVKSPVPSSSSRQVLSSSPGDAPLFLFFFLYSICKICP